MTEFNPTEVEKELEQFKMESNAELNPFNQNPKSSVKLIKNTKGINWEIKCVTGEESLITGLMKSAISAHNQIQKELNNDK